MTATLWIPRGLPASGKTTWAREMLDGPPLGSIVRLNRDELRAMMLPTEYRTPKADAETQVSKVQHGPIEALLRADVDVIVDDTNLRIKFVRNLMQLAARAGAHSEVVDTFLDVDVDTCIQRDAARPAPVGEEVIRGMHTKFLSGGRSLRIPALDAPVSGKPYIPVPDAPRAIVVDIDGTVALHGDRNPYDTSRYDEDQPNPAVIETVGMAAAAGYALIFCSGRSAEFRDVTERWIERVLSLPFGSYALFMRPAGDTRNDAIIKLELFDQYIRNSHDVRWVLDDRDRVVEAWRSIGLTVYQVAPGDF
jgi:predicted kinase